MAEALGSAAIGEAYKDGRNLLTNIYHYAKNLKNNYESMRGEAERLRSRRDDYKAEANKALGKQLTNECENWIKDVGDVEVEVRELVSKYTNEIQRELRWRWHRLWSRSRLSEKLAEMCEKLRRIRRDGDFNKGIMVESLPKRVQKVGRQIIEANTSLHSIVEEIVGSLTDITVKKIGVWGIPGVGKTTILENVNDDEKIERMFDIVILVTLSRNQSIKENIEDVQRQIVRRLKLNTIDRHIDDDIANIISVELENKKYLLILDEVTFDLDLHAIGIRLNQVEGKIVFAASNKLICSNMDADTQFNVKPLSDKDAWKMFSGKVGPGIDFPGFKSIAQLVAFECTGIPLVIDRVAKAFQGKGNDKHLWDCGLESLRLWPRIEIQGVNEVLEVLKVCYEELVEEDKKNCFLYIALYPGDRKICRDYLLGCWNDEGFIHDTRRCGRGYEILDNLIKLSLLERIEKKKYIKMHKLLRNMALRILSQRENCIAVVRAGEGLKVTPVVEEWERANQISLMDNELCRLLESPNCNSLVTLLLQRNHCLKIIPKHFFQSMNHLRVLDLHGTGITSLPATVFHLISLKALYLNSCHSLTKFPSIKKGHLHLEVLDIRGTGINNIPTVVGTFSQLKCLRMSLSNSALRRVNQGRLQIAKINRNVISRLSLLEELSIDVEPQNHRWDKVAMTITSEVASLTHLLSLSFCFPKVDSLTAFINERPELENLYFMFHVGYHGSNPYQIHEHFDYPINRCLKYANGEGVDQTISNVLAETEVFVLINHKGVSRLSDFGIQNMKKMQGCLIDRCSEIETIIDVHTATEDVLISLKKMVITNVPNLVRIWKGPVHPENLVWLKTLNLIGCASLKKIFSNGMIQQLSRLQHLKVQGCPEIEELIMVSENGALQSNSLPKLKTLVLLDLPKMTSIWTGDSLEWTSLKSIQILSCDLLKRLPFHDDKATKLVSIEGKQTWWSALEWQDQSTKQRFSRLFIIHD